MTKEKTIIREEFSTRFNKQLEQAPIEIKRAFLEVLHFFRDDPYHPALRNHELKEKFAGYRSIDITEDWRVVFKEDNNGQKVIIFHLLGTHKQLYG